MPGPDQQYETAISAVDEWLAGAYPGTARADRWRIQQHQFDAAFIGWTVPASEKISVLVVVDRNFPYSAPRTAVFGPHAPKHAPHVEEHLRLCTLGSSARTDSLDPVGVVREYVHQSILLLEGISAGKFVEDFTIDFEAYWLRSINPPRRIWTLVDLRPPSREAFVCSVERRTLFSDDVSRLYRWVGNSTNQQSKIEIFPAFFVWLDPLPSPPDYPSTLSEIRALILDRAPEVELQLGEVLASSAPIKAIVFGGECSPGVAGGGAFLIEDRARLSGNSKRPRAVKGFRPGKAPPEVSLRESLVSRAALVELDGAITRLPRDTYSRLENRRVSIIGCGSLGAGVARLLAQSGVKHIKIFDPENLGWENIGRHELGAAEVGQNKAVELAATLRRKLPETEIVGYDKDWRSIQILEPDIFGQDDLVISATADWGSDCALSDLLISGAFACPLLYGWMERNAAAAHALSVIAGGSDFRSRFDNTGNAKFAITGWWEDEAIPGCAASTSAYGAIELGQACSHLARAALDLLIGNAEAPFWRVSIGSTSALEAAGGYWTSRFISAVGDPGAGGTSYALEW